MKYLSYIFVMLLSASIALADNNPANTLAKMLLEKAGVRATICEMPRVGDGRLAAALAQLGIAQVHALAPDAKAAAAASPPAEDAGALGSQVLIETGTPDALPLGDWVADLYLVADATDANLKTLSAAEAGRVLSPYRGIALVGNPAGAKAKLSKSALATWARGTGGTVTIAEGADGLWAVVKMPPLKGGDDWGHYYHGPDNNPVSTDAAFSGTNYQLQAVGYSFLGFRNETTVASSGRCFTANSSIYGDSCINMWYQIPPEIVARSLYNAQILWRRAIPEQYGEMGSSLVATPDKFYMKDGNGVLILNPETGAQIARVPVTTGPNFVRWIALQDDVLLTLVGPRPYDALIDGVTQVDNAAKMFPVWKDSYRCSELTAWSATTYKPLWKYPATAPAGDINANLMAVNGKTIYLLAHENTAVALDLNTGAPRWSKPTTEPRLVTNYSGNAWRTYVGEPMALATDAAYVIFHGVYQQFQAFAAADGTLLWDLSGKEYPGTDAVAITSKHTILFPGKAIEIPNGRNDSRGAGMVEWTGVRGFGGRLGVLPGRRHRRTLLALPCCAE